MDPILLADPYADSLDDLEARIVTLEATRRVYDPQVVRFGPDLTGGTEFFIYGRETTSTSFVPMWTARLAQLTAPALAFASYSLAAVGATAEWRIVVTDADGSSTSPVGSASGTGGYRFVGFDWLHERTLWRGDATITYEARRAAGAGAVAAYYPQSTLRDPAQALIVAAWTVV